MPDTPGPAPLLSYSFETLPDPLQVNTPASLKLDVDNQSGARITCQQIVVTLPVGTNAKDLIAGTSVVAVPAPGWNQTVDGGAITFTPTGGSIEIGTDGLTFMLAITVNGQPGAATVRIDETASSPANPFTPRSIDWVAAKFPIDFSLSDLTPVPLGNTDLLFGSPAQLFWTATGEGVSCTLSYQPAESGTQVTIGVPNSPDGSSYATEKLTRSGTVIFTLVAQVPVPEQDEPLTRQAQLAVTVEALSLNVTVEPLAVGMNGLVRLTWDAPNADHCADETGLVMPASGTRYIVLQETRTFVITAYGPDGQFDEWPKVTIPVDPTIVATESGYDLSGANGAGGTRGDFTTGPTPGGNGADVTLTLTVPPLDQTFHPMRVIPISLAAGNGGDGGTMVVTGWGDSEIVHAAGGAGGNVSLQATTDPSQAPAQVVISAIAGYGGLSDMAGGRAQAGATLATYDGFTIELPPPPVPPPYP